MSFVGEACRMAVRSLWSRKMRSSLTILGVVIGVAVVVAITSLGDSFEASITGQFDAIDDRSIFVTAGSDGPQNGPPDAGQFGLVFTSYDRQQLSDIPGVERVVASGIVPVTGLDYQGRDQVFETLTASTADADEVRNPDDYLLGGPFMDGEREIVLGYNVALTLSGKGAETPSVRPGDAITITRIDGTNITATVAGILDKQESLFGSNNGQAFVPVDPFYDTQRKSPNLGTNVRVYTGFTVVAASGTDIQEVQDDVEEYMLERSDASLLLADVEDVSILVATASDITDQISTAFDQVTLFIGGIAGVSLVVGGIMIGTIMLISVTERTKEIGVMKAIGGLDREILLMFLIEAAIIGLIGSILGVLLGTFAGFALVEGLFAGEDVDYVIAWDWMGWGVLAGTTVGIIAGLLPARRATRIQPVEALSYE